MCFAVVLRHWISCLLLSLVYLILVCTVHRELQHSLPLSVLSRSTTFSLCSSLLTFNLAFLQAKFKDLLVYMAYFRDSQLVTCSILCFVAGFTAGYQFAVLRRKWLQVKQDFLKKKLNETKKRLDVS